MFCSSLSSKESGDGTSVLKKRIDDLSPIHPDRMTVAMLHNAATRPLETPPASAEPP